MTVATGQEEMLSYDPNTLWTFKNKLSQYVKTERLILQWEPNWAALSDDYPPDETSAVEMWRKWIERVDWQKESTKLGLPLGHVSIGWLVIDAWEGAPFCEDDLDEDFLTFFTWPENEEHGRVQWTRCPVQDLRWDTGYWHKAGFIQVASGWKPSPLQPAMNVTQVARAAMLPEPKF